MTKIIDGKKISEEIKEELKCDVSALRERGIVPGLVVILVGEDSASQENVGRMMIDDARFLPCTPAGILELLKRSGINVGGKNVTIVGRSNVVGKPMAVMFINLGATVTVCHSGTINLKEACARADILISAAGKAGLIVADMVKKDAVVVDVGINRNDDGRLVGDVDYIRVYDKTQYITPVPGGVGPMTIMMLMQNTIIAAKS